MYRLTSSVEERKVGSTGILTLWNFTYVLRAGMYFVFKRLLRLTGLHDATAKKKQNRIVELGREFRADHELPLEGEALSAPSYTAMRRLAQIFAIVYARRCLSAERCVTQWFLRSSSVSFFG